MGSLLVVLLVAAGAFLWLRAMRSARQRWLERLNLPGTWCCETDDNVLDLSGALDEGTYFSRGTGGVDRGSWVLKGHTLVLVGEGGGRTELDLRLFDQDRIGIDGPGFERRVYSRAQSNVVPLRRRG